jgi:ketosteroid isomerase-like protein
MLFVTSCTQSYNQAADEAAIAKLRTDEMAVFGSGDVGALESIFSDDTISMPPNEPALNGLAAVRTWAENLFKVYKISGEYTSADLTLAGDWAFDRLTMKLTMTPIAGGEAIEETGKCIHIYKRQADGSWKIAQDIWNMDAPAAPAPQVSDSSL